MINAIERAEALRCQLTIKGTQGYIEKYFPVVRASSLSLEDDFLKYEPKAKQQIMFKKMLVKAIESGLSDFRAQSMDPSINCEGGICFSNGMFPAIGATPYWWEENAKRFMPEKESRLGTKKERIAFLGYLIKYLVEEQKYSIGTAWRLVCNNSKDLGHYADSKEAKYDFESTGSRQLGIWYDLGNTSKIVSNDEFYEFCFYGGSYKCIGNKFPLVTNYDICNPNCVCGNSVGWIVLSV